MKKLFTILILSCIFTVKTSYADKIAVIGGGASGLVAAWLLEQKHDVTVYEAQDRLGGHANSIEVMVDGAPVVVEAGAEFFNEAFYPNFMKLLRYLDIPLKSFTLVSTFYKTNGSDQIILPPYHDGKVEWGSLTPANLYRSLQLKTVIDNGRKLIKKHDTVTTLHAFVDGLSVSKSFKVEFLYPLLAAAWGVTPEDVQDYSAYNALKYLIEGYDTEKYRWYEVTGGLKKYIESVRDSLRHTEIRLNSRVKEVGKMNTRYTVMTEQGDVKEYDHLVFATDASVASHILGTLNETADLAQLLGKIRYIDTKIAIHGDARFMPPKKDDWRVANVRFNGSKSALTMYKAWKSKTPIFKSWVTYDVRSPKDTGSPVPDKLYALINYRHPVTDYNFFMVQDEIRKLQGNNNIWFVGMWTYDNDSHESAIASAVRVAQHLAPDSERLKVFQ
ncbi:hypothetical protein AQUSIP_19340 [Aquicella siphonis]|uniref:Amine oxidase domain-containing protein n=1 Tax=Aquicella siphonis TaxID=254247 RepID=A0A5E4PJS9_9COXI|nr:FAD-dependent oxidoreductase [Aquicella siphonis]VVC76611.1 hypothetical protein AQUSIP_19340 [Aquicella siphonis]